MKKENNIYTLQETISQLKELGNEKMRAQNRRNGAGENQHGVRLGDIKKLAKKIKLNHELGLSLWKTNNIDAQLLSIHILKPKMLSVEEIDSMLKPLSFMHLADWFINYVVKKHPKKESLRLMWMKSESAVVGRGGWALTSERIVKNPEGINIEKILDRIENEMTNAAPELQWTMNFALVETGINFPQYRKRALEIGERLGVFRNFPTSKGCTSPYAPIWINEMVGRKTLRQ